MNLIEYKYELNLKSDEDVDNRLNNREKTEEAIEMQRNTEATFSNFRLV